MAMTMGQNDIYALTLENEAGQDVAYKFYINNGTIKFDNYEVKVPYTTIEVNGEYKNVPNIKMVGDTEHRNIVEIIMDTIGTWAKGSY